MPAEAASLDQYEMVMEGPLAATGLDLNDPEQVATVCKVAAAIYMQAVVISEKLRGDPSDSRDVRGVLDISLTLIALKFLSRAKALGLL